MQEQVKLLNKNYHWLETVEGFAVIGSVGGAIASAISQQAIFASLPLSAAVLLNLVNRRLLITSIQHQQAAIADLSLAKLHNYSKQMLISIAVILRIVQQLTNSSKKIATLKIRSNN